MEVNINHSDHPNEYYYKLSATARKLFYKRTLVGHKKIFRANIPVGFIDRIKLYDENKDADMLRSKKETIKKLERAVEGLKNLDSLNLSAKNYERQKLLLEDRIASCKAYIIQCEEMDSKYSEERYKEETREGFKKFFEENYNDNNIPENNESTHNLEHYGTLMEEKIMQRCDEEISVVRKRWKRWLVFNHPDKGGDEKICVRVINEFKHFEKSRRI